MTSQVLRTRVTDLLGCRFPILLAGMGGVARSQLVAAVAEAGGYGFLGMVREPPDLIRSEITAVRARTDHPFGVNLIPAATDPALFEEQLAACFEAEVHALCFFWGVDAELIARARAAGCRVAYQVGSVEEAKAAAEWGVDLIIAQGFEAGGHVRGTVGSVVLLPAVARAVQVPVVASGGFATGASLVAALALGAEGVHVGTRFVATEESFAHPYHKKRIVQARAEDTVYTDVFAINWPPRSPVRALTNSVTEASRDQLLGHDPGKLPREVIARDTGRPIYRYSTDSPLRTTEGDLEALALLAGEAVGLIDDVPPAEEVIRDMVREAEEVLRRLCRPEAETSS